MKTLRLLLVLYLVAALLLTGAVYTAISRWFTPSTVDCADTSWPVAERPTFEIGNVVGEKNERTDEREQRLFVAEVTRKLGPGQVALDFRNHEFARRFLAANAAGDLPVQKIEKAF